MKYKDTGFRAVYGHFCVLALNDKTRAFINDLPDGKLGNAVMTYGYYDREAGLTLEVLSAAVIGDNGFRCGPADPSVSLKMRASALGDTEFFVVDDRDGKFRERYAGKIEMLEAYGVPEEIENTRSYRFLDASRDEFFIDDVRVNMVQIGLENEECWVRITGTAGDTLTGALLNEPYQDFGYHKGDEIPFFVHETDEGEIVCISDLIPTHVIKAEDLEDGEMLKSAIQRFAEDSNEYNFIEVLSILRDSTVWVPCNAIMSDADEEKLLKMLEDAEGDPDAMAGNTFTNDDYIRLVPDILQRGDEFFFPVFSSEEEMGEFGAGFSHVARHMMDVIPLARNNEKNVSGIVVNAGGTGFIVDAKFFGLIEEMESRIEE